MARPAARSDELLALFRAIAAADKRTVSQLLARSPELAQQKAAAGATRHTARPYFFPRISHYAYAGDTALHIAAAAYERTVARALISKGANVRAKNRRGAEPLHYAADGGPESAHWNPAAQAAIVQLLVDEGADPNATDMDGVAPIHRAIRTRCAAAVQALLRSGANPRLKNKRGSTPLHLAVQNTGRGGSGTSSSRQQQGRIIELLITHGARPSDKNSSGKSVIECVTSDWIRTLIEMD